MPICLHEDRYSLGDPELSNCEVAIKAILVGEFGGAPGVVELEEVSAPIPAAQNSPPTEGAESLLTVRKSKGINSERSCQ